MADGLGKSSPHATSRRVGPGATPASLSLPEPMATEAAGPTAAPYCRYSAGTVSAAPKLAVPAGRTWSAHAGAMAGMRGSAATTELKRHPLVPAAARQHELLDDRRPNRARSGSAERRHIEPEASEGRALGPCALSLRVGNTSQQKGLRCCGSSVCTLSQNGYGGGCGSSSSDGPAHATLAVSSGRAGGGEA